MSEQIWWRRALSRLAPVAAGCLLAAGCESSTQQQAIDRQAAPPATDAIVNQDTTSLEQAGAKLTRDSQNRVTAIDLRDIEVADSLAAEMAALTSVTRLTMNRSTMTTSGWEQLGQLSRLQQLDLRGCPVSNEQLTAAVSGMPRLRALRLSGDNDVTTIDDDGLAVLAGCPELKALAIDHLWISEQGLQHLVGNKKLAELYLASTLVDDASMQLIASMSSLRKLRLAKTAVGAAGLETLTALPLEELDISECSQIFDDAMVSVGKLTSLKRLNLWRDAITDEGVNHLAALTNLQWLNLDNTQLSDDGLVHLQGMTKLTFLHLGSTSVSDRGMPQLTGLTALKDLKVTRTAVTEAGVQTVQDALPDVSIQLNYIEQ